MMNIFRINLTIAFVTLLSALYAITQVPAGMELPIHWNSAGEIDKYADANIALLLPPGIMFGLIVLLSALRYLEPRKANLIQSQKAKHAIAFAIILLLAVLEAGYIALIYGLNVQLYLLILFMIGVCFMIIGNYLSKTRSNYFIGIRTPWALQDDQNWRKTHRLSGRLFMISGLIVSIMCWFIHPDQLSFLVIALVVSAAVIPIFYSWWLWRNK